MEKEFVPYMESSELKGLDFNEPCLGWFKNRKFTASFNDLYMNPHERGKELEIIKAPLYQQAFRFFRKKYGLVMVIKPIDDKRLELGYNITKNGLIIKACTTYEEAELACLRKLIEIVKTK